MGEVHGASGGEVPAWPLVRYTRQGFEAGDVVRTQSRCLSAGEAEHQLSVVGDLVSTRHRWRSGQGQRLGDTGGSESPAQKANALACEVEQVPHIGAAAGVV